MRPALPLRGLLALITCLNLGAAQAATASWVEASNDNARVLLELAARYSPESATYYGLDGYEEQILDLSRDRYEEHQADARQAIATLGQRLNTEQDPRVRQDLEILIASAQRDARSRSLDRKHFLPYHDPASTVFSIARGMLDPRSPPAHRQALLVRMNRYAGLEKGYRPFTELARERTLERMAAAPGLLGPFRGDVEQDLASVPVLMAGLRELLEKSGPEGWRKPYRALERQMGDYYAWVRTDILPRARTDFHEPEEVYANNLREYGLDIEPAELVAKALTAYAEIRNEMQALAQLIARERKLEDADYRAVIRALKAGQLPNDRVLSLYQERLAEMERLISEHRVVTLPERAASIRLASLAESARQPAPHMLAPQLINNTGQYGEFVLPVSLPPDPAGRRLAYDDFSHEAGSWTLIAHEARPGHELQYARLVEDGVSQARAIFAANSVNVEGWALYAEAEMKPYLPLEGQLFALQHRMLRAARAFLDPLVNAGTITPDQAKQFLQREAVFSEAMATQEVERYTFRAPGQATAYFYGYQRLLEIRQRAQLALGERFDRLAFNDFVLRQGLLPPALLEAAVMHDFVASRPAN